MTGHFAVETDGLGRVFTRRGFRGAMDSRCALEDVSLTVRRGEIFGVLGPNGAGKTTLIDVLTARLTPTSGRARVAGFDVARYHRWVRPRIGVVTETAASRHSQLTVNDSLRLSAWRRGVNGVEADRRIGSYMHGLGIAEYRHVRSAHLSAGLRQRVDVVRAVLHAPVVLFVDQPTRGLDARTAPMVRAFLRDWKREGVIRSVVMATNDLEEADAICDRVAIIDRGRVLACDTPAALKRRSMAGTRVLLESDAVDATDAHALARRVMTLRDAFLALVGNDRSTENAPEQWVTS